MLISKNIKREFDLLQLGVLLIAVDISSLPSGPLRWTVCHIGYSRHLCMMNVASMVYATYDTFTLHDIDHLKFRKFRKKEVSSALCL